MINRMLTRRIELLPDEDLYGLKDKIELEYYLLESEINNIDEIKKTIAYGIEIVKKSGESSVEKETIMNLFNSRKSTEQLLDILASNTVTPIGLPYVLDDIIGA